MTESLAQNQPRRVRFRSRIHEQAVEKLDVAKYVSPDGIKRSDGEEYKLNEAMKLAFEGEEGKRALEYLRSITVDRICQAGITNEELQHIEGARWLYAIISRRIELGEQKKP